MNAAQHPAGHRVGQRLLVVDADRDTVDDVLEHLRRSEGEGATVQVARTGIEAFALALTFRPDIILIDPDLPDRDGWEVIQRILAYAPCCAVIMSRRAEPEDLGRALRCGARNYVVKPFAADTALPELLRQCAAKPMPMSSNPLFSR